MQIKKGKHKYTSTEMFERNKQAAMKRNVNILKIILIASIVAFGVALIGSFTFDDMNYMKAIYAVVVGLCGVLLFVLHFLKPENVAVIYVVYGLFVAYSTITSAFVSPGYICVTILAFLFQFQVLYLDKSWRINTAAFVSAAIYLCVVLKYKETSLFADELVNVVVFTVLGTILGFFTRRTQLENYEMQTSIKLSEEQYRLAMEHSGRIMCRYDVADRSLSTTSDVAFSFSMPEKIEDVPQSLVQNGYISPETCKEFAGMYEDIQRGKRTGSAVFKCKIATAWHWLKADYSTIFTEDKKPTYAVISYADITDAREKEIAYKKWKQEIEDMPKEKTSLFEWNLTANIPESESGEMVEMIKTLSKDTSKDEFNQRTVMYAQKYVWGEDKQSYIVFLNRERLIGAYNDGVKTCEMEYRELCKDEDYRWMHIAVQLVQYPDSMEIKAYLMFKDIDDERRHILETEARAREDSVTGLLNRNSYRTKVSEVLYNGKKEAKHAFMMIDIDQFKHVNDTFGHISGDRRLIEVADRLKSLMRHDDVIGRLGGDEFAVFMRDVVDLTNVADRAGLLCQAMYKVLGKGVTVSVSIGIAVCPRDGDDFDSLYKKADVALYEAKKQGRNRYIFYARNMDDSAYIANATPIDE